MTVNTSGDPVSWDDYYPYGSIMPGRSQNNASIDGRFKFTEKERDSETGYDYFGARTYDSFIARWLQVDPLANVYPEWSPFNYTLNNPINSTDPDGRAPGFPGYLLNYVKTYLEWMDKLYLVTVTGENKSSNYEVQNLGSLGWIDAAMEFGNIYGVEYFYADGDWYRSKDLNRGPTPTMGMPPDVGMKGGIGGLKVLKNLKAINLPSIKKITINIAHVVARHSKGGASVSPLKSLFPESMNAKQIEAAIKEAYSTAKKISTQGDRVLLRGHDAKSGLNIEMWLNTATKIIETAYPF